MAGITQSVEVLKAGYRLDQTDRDWLQGVLRATLNARPSRDMGLDAAGFFFEVIPGSTAVRFWDFVLIDPPEGISQTIRGFQESLAPEHLRALLLRSTVCATLSQIGLPRLYGQATRLGIKDVLCIQANDATDRGFCLLFQLPRQRSLPRSKQKHWECVAYHLCAALRLRRHLAGMPGPQRPGVAACAPDQADAPGDNRTAVPHIEVPHTEVPHTEVPHTEVPHTEVHVGMHRQTAIAVGGAADESGRNGTVGGAADESGRDGTVGGVADESGRNGTVGGAADESGRNGTARWVRAAPACSIGFADTAPSTATGMTADTNANRLRPPECRDKGTQTQRMWSLLVSGRGTLVEYSNHGGQRYYIVLRNSPEAQALVKLTPREQEVIDRALQGYANKLIAAELALNEATVNTYLRRAMAKLRVNSRAALIRLHGEVVRVELAMGDEHPVVVRPRGDIEQRCGFFGLTTAEKVVAACILRGQSNAEIAQMRGSQIRTVANQVQSIFRKVGVNSRAELAAVLVRSADSG